MNITTNKFAIEAACLLARSADHFADWKADQS